MVGERVNVEVFKTCPLCSEQWATLEEFVRDERLKLDGYSAFFDDPGKGLIFVTHLLPHCGTTLTLAAAKLRPLYRGPVHLESHHGAEDCNRLCLDRRELDECHAPCAMAWVRTVLQHLRRHEMPDDSVPAPR